MSDRAERVAMAFVLASVGVAAMGLALQALDEGSTAVAVGFSGLGGLGGVASLAAWSRGDRRDRRRLPLLLIGLALPAFAAFALAPALADRPWGVVLDGLGVGCTAIALLALYRLRP